MSRSFVYLPNSPEVNAAIHVLAVDQWAKWQSGKAKQGVVWGPHEIPTVKHPDVLEEHHALPEHMRFNALALTYGRVMQFALLGAEVVDSLILSVREDTEIDAQLTDSIASGFHDTWWLLRRAWFLSGHTGDKSWEDHTKADKTTDLGLVRGWAELFSAYDASDHENSVALMEFVRG